MLWVAPSGEKDIWSLLGSHRPPQPEQSSSYMVPPRLNLLASLGVWSIDKIERHVVKLGTRHKLKSGLQLILHGAYACFVNTATDFDDPNCLDREIGQGCLIADYCKSEGVQHVVLSSQLHSQKICSIMARHLVAKAEIEQYMRDLALPLTSLIMPVYYEDMLDMLKPCTMDGKNFDIEIPMGTTPLDMMCVEDVGPVVVNILRNGRLYLGKTESICGDKIKVKEIAEVLTRHLWPKVFKDKQLTVHEFYQNRSCDLKGCIDWANMFQFFQRVDQRYNLSITKQMNPNLKSFDDWVRANAQALNAAL
ncbi:NmrA-like family domain-containing protein 1 [Elysia marginata]|uniref:NmrA-like family domain-containing protein 1 n=1 Tax=Elysia marginata TaxID=1093978 RepID=A0AAV4IMF6_9GAST|nr:NmrA-like family domain-containing protein 1 [Elysia marginata]